MFSTIAMQESQLPSLQPREAVAAEARGRALHAKVKLLVVLVVLMEHCHAPAAQPIASSEVEGFERLDLLGIAYGMQEELRGGGGGGVGNVAGAEQVLGQKKVGVAVVGLLVIFQHPDGLEDHFA